MISLGQVSQQKKGCFGKSLLTHLDHISSPGAWKVIRPNPWIVVNWRGQMIDGFKVVSVVIFQYTKLIIDNGKSTPNRPVIRVHLEGLLVVWQSEVKLIEAEKTVWGEKKKTEKQDKVTDGGEIDLEIIQAFLSRRRTPYDLSD